MKTKHFCLWLWFLAIGLGIQCKEKCSDPTNPQCGNYDPCSGKKAVSAAFTIHEAVANRSKEWKYYDTDTIFTDAAYFTALEENAQYEWRIGADVLRTQKVTRTQFPRGQTIPITLIVTKTPDKSCFPNDTGRDSIMRWMYITAANEPSRVYGRFRGFFDKNPKDTSTLSIYRKDSLMFNNQIEIFLIIRGLANNCELKTYNFGDNEVGYKKLGFSYFSEGWCNYPKGIFELHGKWSDTLTCIYTEYDSFPHRVNRQFIGIRQ